MRKGYLKYSGKNFTLEQDEDVLDTWFFWVMAFLNSRMAKQQRRYGQVLSILHVRNRLGYLFFWVVRMILLGIKLTGKSPFNEVFCHSLVRDAQGRKMSKSLGNVVDPIDVISCISLEDLHSKLYGGVS